MNAMIQTNHHSSKIPKENMDYACLPLIAINSIIKMDSKYCPYVYLEECKRAVKENKMSHFIDAELKLDFLILILNNMFIKCSCTSIFF